MLDSLPPVVVRIVADSKALHTGLAKATGELDQFGNRTGSALQKAQTIGKFALGGLAVLAVASVKMAGDFQESMTQLVTGAGESEKNIKLVGDGILRMAGQVGISAMNLSKGMYLIESAGYHGAQGLLVLKAASEGARVGAADMQTVADGLTTALHDYAIPADQAAVVTSKLVATVAAGKTHMQDLSGAMATVLPAASAAGVGLNQVLGAMATMTAGGTPAAVAATYLKQTIIALSNPLPKAQKEMAALGLSSVDVAQHLGQRGLSGTFDLLTGAIAKHTSGGLVMIEQLKKAAHSAKGFQAAVAALPPVMQTQIGALANMMGGSKNLQAALELTGTNAKTFADNVKNIGAASTEAGGHVSGFALTQKDLNTQLANITAGLGAISIQLGQKLIPIVSSAIGFFKSHKTVTEALALAIGGVLVIAIGTYIGGIAMAAAASAAAFVGMIAKGLIWAVSMDTYGAMAALALLPLVIAVAAVGIAAYELYKHWDQVWGFIKDIAGAAWQFIVGVFNNAAGTVSGVMASISNVITGAWDTIVGAFHTAVGFIKGHMALIVGAVFLLFPPIGAIIAIVHLLWTNWSQIWGAIKTITEDVWSVLKTVFHALVTVGLVPIKAEIWLLKTVWDAVWAAVSEVVKVAWGLLKPVLDQVVKVGLWTIKTEINLLKGIWDTVWHGIQATVEQVWSVLKPIFDTMAGAIKTITGGIGGIAGAVGHVGGGAISGVGHMLGFADGGWVPGPVGAPVPAIVHGGEFVVSHAMQQQSGGRGSMGGTHITFGDIHTQAADPAGIAEEIAWRMRVGAA